jgi:hypothetical protein
MVQSYEFSGDAHAVDPHYNGICITNGPVQVIPGVCTDDGNDGDDGDDEFDGNFNDDDEINIKDNPPWKS